MGDGTSKRVDVVRPSQPCEKAEMIRRIAELESILEERDKCESKKLRARLSYLEGEAGKNRCGPHAGKSNVGPGRHYC